VLEYGVDHSCVGCRIALLKIAQISPERNENHVRRADRELVFSRAGSSLLRWISGSAIVKREGLVEHVSA
jgi:hypothetical protein